MIWQIDEVNARTQVVTAHYGNAVGKESHTYDTYGFPTSTSFRTINGSNSIDTDTAYQRHR